MVARISFMLMLLTLIFSEAKSQNSCVNPQPDSCQYPDTCCVIPLDECPFDQNWNGLDIVYMVNFFKGSRAPSIYSQLDINCNCRINGMDIVYLVNYLKGRGPAPLCCIYVCGPRELASIGDFVWNDLDTNGVQDPMEPGMGDVIVQLYDCQNTVLQTDTTDSSGHFLFSDLTPGNYRLHFESPLNYWFTSPHQGTNDSLDSDADPVTGLTGCTILIDGEQDMTWDAGLRSIYLPKSSIGNLVWNDSNMNGVQDSTEYGLGGITVELFDCSSNVMDTFVTDNTGFFLFCNLYPGQYRLHFSLPEGYVFSPIDQGDEALDSDADPVTGFTECIDLGFAAWEMDWDAGLYNQSIENCTRPMGYWKNHCGYGPQPDIVSPLLPLWLGIADSTESIHVTDASIAYDIFRMHTFGDPSNGITKLYAQFLAAKLNIANGADYDAIAEAVDLIDAFLATTGWQQWPQLDRDDKNMILGWMDTLANYNEGIIGPGACDEDIDNR